MDYKLPQLPIRKENSNKGSFGKVLNISGSEYMPGAAYLSSIAALKIGAGYVELASVKNVLDTVAIKAPEIVLSNIENIENTLNNINVLLIGCGLSTSDFAKNIFHKSINTIINKNITTIIDADGINILSQNNNIKLPNKTILTPHPKEAARLLNCTLEDILENTKEAAIEISKRYKVTTALKTHETIVTTPDQKVYKNTTGNSALAKAGSGDVLAGMIAGLAAQGMNCFEATTLGVYLHGLSGDLAKEDLTAYSVLATDTIRYIPYAIKIYLKQYN